MAISVEDCLLRLQDAHPAFHVVRTDAGVGIRALEQARDVLLTQLLRERPDVLTATEGTTALSAAQFTSGWDYTTGVVPLALLDVEIQEANGVWRPVERVRWDGRFLARRVPAVTTRGSIIYPLGDYPDYSGFTTWRARYIPQQPALGLRGSGATITVFPDHARQALVSIAAVRVGARLGTSADPAVDLGDLGRTRDEDVVTFFDALALDAAAETFLKRDVLE